MVLVRHPARSALSTASKTTLPTTAASTMEDREPFRGMNSEFPASEIVDDVGVEEIGRRVLSQPAQRDECVREHSP